MKVQDTIEINGKLYPNERDMTPEEEAEMKQINAENSNTARTPEERLSIMEDAFAELCEVIFNG